MHGGSTQARSTWAPQSPTPGAMGQLPSLGTVSKGAFAIPVTILVLIGIYLTWVFVHQHEKVQEQLEPKTIAANLHNLFLIGLSAIVSILFLKLATAKLAVLTKWTWLEDVAAVIGAA